MSAMDKVQRASARSACWRVGMGTRVWLSVVGCDMLNFLFFYFCVAIGKREVKIHRVDAERSI